MLAVTTPAVVDHPQFFRRNAQQGLVQNRCQLCCLCRGGHGEARRIGTDRAADDQFGVTCYGVVGIDQGRDDGIDCATAQQCHGIVGAFGLDPAGLRIPGRQQFGHLAVAGNGDAAALQLFQ
ncbi:hypothetical protein D3C79_662390 [compost metagenome]